MLTDSEFSIQGQCAINLMMTKIDIINTFLLMKTGRNYIQMKTGRLKSYDSVCKKMQKKGLDMNFAQAVEKINDLIGVRAVCAYVDDIYKVADLIQKQQDIRIIKIKENLNRIMAERCHKPLEQVMQDTERDNFMSAQEACDYGLIDRVIAHRE